MPSWSVLFKTCGLVLLTASTHLSSFVMMRFLISLATSDIQASSLTSSEYKQSPGGLRLKPNGCTWTTSSSDRPFSLMGPAVDMSGLSDGISGTDAIGGSSETRSCGLLDVSRETVLDRWEVSCMACATGELPLTFAEVVDMPRRALTRSAKTSGSSDFAAGSSSSERFGSRRLRTCVSKRPSIAGVTLPRTTSISSLRIAVT
mmetsp:Transcript_70694/g.112063  ORF Transcript_70694/g.112063 Transcript_70694/m.112063 type:complete len:203 (+) Transcript_70694:65-673(+)